jgi:hypothetical protein
MISPTVSTVSAPETFRVEFRYCYHTRPDRVPKIWDALRGNIVPGIEELGFCHKAVTFRDGFAALMFKLRFG